MSQEVDVLIIGAGPAGLSAGIVFANQGVKTLICEQKTLPVDKACGEGVMPAGLAHLDRLGVLKFLSHNDYHPFKGIRYISEKHQTADGCFQEGPGWGIQRLELSRAFVQRAQELKDLRIIQSIKAKPLIRMGGRIAVQLGDELYLTRLLVGADGLNSRVRHWAGLDCPAAALRRWGARQHYLMPPWSDHVEIYWGRGAEAYITPCGKNLTSLTFLWYRNLFPNIKGGKGLFPSLLAAFPALKEKFAKILPYDRPKTIGPMHRGAISPVGDGVILIGDAAGYLDALTGEGISLATAEALALETNIVPLLRNGYQDGSMLSRRQLKGYCLAYQKIVRPYYRMTRLALIINRHPGLAEWIIKIFARQPRLFQRVLSANMGQAHREIPR